MVPEVQESKEKKEEVEEEKESQEVNEIDEAELKKLLVIKKDEDIAIDAIPLATKLPKMNIKFKGGLLGLKRLHGFLEVTTAQHKVTAVSSKIKTA
ncbi:hypothetical protein Tco_0864611 [Tanacetum coccineum]